ncbi:MAG: serine protease inhibitor [Clostridiales bacterium]|nr:serine protease inhibitor [Clostridiales bacterium]
MKNRIIALSLSLALMAPLMLSLSGCSSKTEVQAKDLMAGIEANTSQQDIKLSEAQKNEIADFGVSLFKDSTVKGENTLISPLSLLCALAMTANGASGETLVQMEDVFGLSLPELNAFISSYTEGLPSGEKYKLGITNSIWLNGDKDFEVLPSFLQTNADYYGASVYKRAFDDSACEEINIWVNDKTDGMVEKIIDEIPRDALMYLINALVFDGEWENIYNESQVTDGEFNSFSGEKQKAKMMYADEDTYLEGDSVTGFLKYYADRKYAFAALLPDEGISIDEYIASLTGEKLMSLMDKAQDVKVKTAIPKFENEFSMEMSEVLMTMGMTDAFDSSAADFSSLSNLQKGEIFISKILHKTRITVDERGTKAGAATAVLVSRTSMPLDEPKTVYLDRPFVYMLIDCETKLPLFIGSLAKIKA